MVAFVLEIHENLLQTVVPVRYMDIELAFAGNDDVDIFVGGVSSTRGSYIDTFFG
ncbi:hypothetical protein [Paenibacillus sp. 1A_MP2]|uniref:hypothetical protein n=1 Tax=Paenibacillus sp. 1A_MP2 TaxID=3457495 RepID=UPI003FCDBA74